MARISHATRMNQLANSSTKRSARYQIATQIVAAIAVVGGFGACGRLTCDSKLKESRAANNRAINFQKQGQYQQAESEYRRAMALKPQNHEAAHNLGLMFVSQNQWAKAADAFTEALKRNTSDAQYYYDAGHAYLERDCPEQQDGARLCATPPTEAEKALAKAVQMQPTKFKAWYSLGQAYLQLDKPREAADAFTHAGRANARFLSPFVELANLYLSWDKWDEAQRVTTAALSVPENRGQGSQTSMLYFLQGRASEFLNQNEKALEAYDNAVKVEPNNVPAIFHLGALYAKLDNKPAAKEWLQKVVKMGGGGNANLVGTANSLLDPLVR